LGTRLLSESLIKAQFPQLKYLRIHTNGIGTATIYAWKEDLQLPQNEIKSLKKFTSDFLLAHIGFVIKPYNLLQNDKVPQVYELPNSVIQAAMSGKLNQSGIVAVINALFSSINMNFNRYDSATGIIHFDANPTSPIADVEKELIDQYLYEIIPLGTKSSVLYPIT
jgi:hypothetical protein